MRAVLRHVVALTAAGGIFLAGCTRTRVETVARLNLPQNATRVQTVDRTGAYVAKWTFKNRLGLREIPGARVLALEGQQLGFERTPDGELLAVHEDQRFPIESPPTDARYVVWHHEATEFTEVGAALAAAGEGTLEVLKLTALTGLVLSLVLLESELDDDDDCDCRHKWKCRH